MWPLHRPLNPLLPASAHSLPNSTSVASITALRVSNGADPRYGAPSKVLRTGPTPGSEPTDIGVPLPPAACHRC